MGHNQCLKVRGRIIKVYQSNGGGGGVITDVYKSVGQ